MGDSLDQLAYLVNLMEAREQHACFQNHIPLAICNFCSSNFHGNDTCPMLLNTNFCGETQIAGDPQGQYYWVQNSYLEEQPIWSHQQFQQNESLEAQSQHHLEEIIKQMAESNLQFEQHDQSSLQSVKNCL
ncbi:hypothetical protein QL285_027752 [Trifolium repens]|nr:hypothetical protein QL285_027752 [Trifolium repens]